MGSEPEVENAMQHSALYSVGKATRTRLKWYGSTDKSVWEMTRVTNRPEIHPVSSQGGAGTGLCVRGTGEYGVKGMCSDSAVWSHDAERLWINQTAHFECALLCTKDW